MAFIGDDLGDLPAFDALDGFEQTGVATVRVAVRGTEQADPVVAQADVTAEGPEGVLAALSDLAARLAG